MNSCAGKLVPIIANTETHSQSYNAASAAAVLWTNNGKSDKLEDLVSR